MFRDRLRRFLYESHSAKIVAIGYMFYILAGWLVLNLPFMATGGISSLDHLFTATSAVSTTGLTTVDVSSGYSFLGQLVIMILIQVGGVGYMTFGSFVVLSRTSEISLRREEIGRTVFTLPESYRIDKFLRSVISFTAVLEALGAAALYFIFDSQGVAMPLWQAIFHSVSAFCTAGFSLFSTSFVDYADNFWLNLVVGILSYLGAVGFIVCVDYWRKIRGKVPEVTLTSKIIIWSTIWLSIIGTICILAFEPTLNGLPAESKILRAAFQAMTAMTTVGFNTIDTGALSNATMLLVIMLMVIGASPSGTGGGLKSTTFSALFGIMKNALQGRDEVTFWGKKIPITRLWAAVASMSFYTTALVTGTYLLELTQTSDFADNLFETASALGTVGLSAGITSGLTSLGKIIIILMMYCGRLGPITFGMALFYHNPKRELTSDSDLAV